ncbi:hypothetical protein GQR58_003583 [Nymphon striatum]|nr:hypothetical protein GQR58_003583 [Nymphon striatum]
MAYQRNRLQLYQQFLQLLLQLAQREDEEAPVEVVAVAVPSFEALLLEIGECGSGEGERALFFRGDFRRAGDFLLTAFFFEAMLVDIVEYMLRCDFYHFLITTENEQVFQKQVLSLIEVIKQFGNTFCNDFPELVALYSRTCDEDSVATTIHTIEEFGCQQLENQHGHFDIWVSFGAARNQRMYHVNAIFNILGVEKAETLSIFYLQAGHYIIVCWDRPFYLFIIDVALVFLFCPLVYVPCMAILKLVVKNARIPETPELNSVLSTLAITSLVCGQLGGHGMSGILFQHLGVSNTSIIFIAIFFIMYLLLILVVRPRIKSPDCQPLISQEGTSEGESERNIVPQCSGQDDVLEPVWSCGPILPPTMIDLFEKTTEEMEQCDDDIEEKQSDQDSDYEELLSDNED